MPELDWTTRREAGVTLVELTVTNDVDGPRRVRVRSAIPVLPPRSDGVPATGWTEVEADRVAVVEVPPGATRGLGYASPETADPPATLVDAEPPEPREAPEPVADAPAVEQTPDGVVRDLPEAGPPRDAVPPADDGGGEAPRESPQSGPVEADGGAPIGTDGPRTAIDPTEAGEIDDAADTGAGPGHPGATADTTGRSSQPESAGEGPDDDRPPSRAERPREQPDTPVGWTWGGDDPTDGVDLPPTVADWLDGVVRRIDLAADLAAAGGGPEATALVAAAGGPGAVDRLADRVADDPDRLRRLAARAEELADRAEAVAVPEGVARRSP